MSSFLDRWLYRMRGTSNTGSYYSTPQLSTRSSGFPDDDPQTTTPNLRNTPRAYFHPVIPGDPLTEEESLKMKKSSVDSRKSSVVSASSEENE
ncbi:Hypothetical protein PP7435_CHR1-1283 [Komagataella phaffii CBS 7435]|uniref:Uncharacterized protein n=2 Tax=Komagataella phaffii TaxID=460519 RepID=C4QYL0_KOMPG|nr:Hypothetical protein PAS_chr1-4_0481 [Komagataella phaffii GS115]CAH2447157.1 Hypothetical protein BQ9382_C1-6706 [Komagataella phaffii CBS 7435]CAY68333.1 Hypothetical protein PAS_chr1-4_0481 [Komagataella phaffii GS115]CCA37402.1 Hypothetical protein PP7435_CHR1-1283 [Komagataella phaffii CBS 7435]